ncbi:MAG: hypothetical protein ACYC0B_02365 [Gemmatimonadaceae bacterium]
MPAKKKRTEPAVKERKPVWAYVYQIHPPQPESALASVRMLLDREHAVSTDGAGRWEGRLVVEELVTHILVVSDNPDQTRAVNRELEAELTKLTSAFAVTSPMAITDDESTPAA